MAELDVNLSIVYFLQNYIFKKRPEQTSFQLNDQQNELLLMQIQETKFREQNIKKMNDNIMAALSDITNQSQPSTFKIIKDLQEKIDNNAQEINELRKHYDGKVRVIENQKQELEKKIQLLEAKNETQQHFYEKQIAELQFSKQNIEQQLNLYQNEFSKEIESINVETNFKSNQIVTKNEELLNQIDNYEQTIKSLKIELINQQQLHQQMLDQKSKEFQQRNDTKKNQICELESQIEQIKQQNEEIINQLLEEKQQIEEKFDYKLQEAIINFKKSQTQTQQTSEIKNNEKESQFKQYEKENQNLKEKLQKLMEENKKSRTMWQAKYDQECNLMKEKIKELERTIKTLESQNVIEFESAKKAFKESVEQKYKEKYETSSQNLYLEYQKSIEKQAEEYDISKQQMVEMINQLEQENKSYKEQFYQYEEQFENAKSIIGHYETVKEENNHLLLKLQNLREALKPQSSSQMIFDDQNQFTKSFNIESSKRQQQQIIQKNLSIKQNDSNFGFEELVNCHQKSNNSIKNSQFLQFGKQSSTEPMILNKESQYSRPQPQQKQMNLSKFSNDQSTHFSQTQQMATSLLCEQCNKCLQPNEFFEHLKFCSKEFNQEFQFEDDEHKIQGMFETRSNEQSSFEQQILQQQINELGQQLQNQKIQNKVLLTEKNSIMADYEMLMVELKQSQMSQALIEEKKEECEMALKNEIKFLINKLLKAKGKQAEMQSQKSNYSMIQSKNNQVVNNQHQYDAHQSSYSILQKENTNNSMRSKTPNQLNQKNSQRSVLGQKQSKTSFIKTQNKYHQQQNMNVFKSQIEQY